MILLDTNVISEVMRPFPDIKVIAWLDQRLASEYWLSAVTVAEIGLGIGLLSDGKRKVAFAEMAAKRPKRPIREPAFAKSQIRGRDSR